MAYGAEVGATIEPVIQQHFGICHVIVGIVTGARVRRRAAGLATIVFCCSVLIQNASAQHIVVNLAVAEGSLSKNAVRAIFGMRLRNWPDGSPIKVFVLVDQSPLHKVVSKRILNIFPHQLRRSWDRLVYSGTGQAPIEVVSEEDMRVRVASTVGAIGYLDDSTIDDSIRVVLVE